MNTERSKRLLLTVDKSVMQSIRAAESPMDVVSIIAKYPFQDAVCIIDNLDPLTAAFVITMFREQERGSAFVACNEKYAKSLLAKASRLRIRGTLGLCYARDQVYRETGYFAAI